MLVVLIFFLSVSRHASSWVHWSFNFFIVIAYWRFHLKDCTSWISRYMYTSFCDNIGITLSLYFICWFNKKVLKVGIFVGFLFGHLVSAHFVMLSSSPLRLFNFSIFVIWEIIAFNVLVRRPRSSKYATLGTFASYIWEV